MEGLMCKFTEWSVKWASSWLDFGLLAVRSDQCGEFVIWRNACDLACAQRKSFINYACVRKIIAGPDYVTQRSASYGWQAMVTNLQIVNSIIIEFHKSFGQKNRRLQSDYWKKNSSTMRATFRLKSERKWACSPSNRSGEWAFLCCF